MTPEQLAKSDSEQGHQRALFAWSALHVKQWPELALLFHIPNGGSRGDSAKTRAIHGAALKADGVRPGVPDLFLPVARHGVHGLFIEMKKPSAKPKRQGSKGGLSDEQLAFRDAVHGQGYGWSVCYSWEEARDILVRYLS